MESPQETQIDPRALCSVPAEKSYGLVGSSRKGLSHEEAEKRLAETGENVLTAKKPKPITLPADASAVGKRLADLQIPVCAHVMAIISGGEIVVPRGDTVFSAGDEVLILSSCGGEADLRHTFGVHSEPR